MENRSLICSMRISHTCPHFWTNITNADHCVTSHSHPTKKDRFFNCDPILPKLVRPPKRSSSLLQCTVPLVPHDDHVADVRSLAFNAHHVGAKPAQLIAFNARGILAVALGQSVYTLSNGSERRVLTANGPIDAVCWTDSGLVVSSRGFIELWDEERRKLICHYEGHQKRCRALASRGRRLASGGDDGIVRVLDTSTNIAKKLGPHRGAVTHIAFSPDGAQIASAGTDNMLCVWGDSAPSSFKHESAISGVAWVSPTVIAVGEANGKLLVMSLNPATVLHCIDTGSAISGLAFTSRRGLFVSHAGEQFCWQIWSRDCRQRGCFDGHSDDVLSIAVNEKDDEVATIGADQALRIWKMEDSGSCSGGSDSTLNSSGKNRIGICIR